MQASVRFKLTLPSKSVLLSMNHCLLPPCLRNAWVLEEIPCVLKKIQAAYQESNSRIRRRSLKFEPDPIESPVTCIPRTIIISHAPDMIYATIEPDYFSISLSLETPRPPLEQMLEFCIHIAHPADIEIRPYCIA